MGTITSFPHTSRLHEQASVFSFLTSDSTGPGTGTVPGQNNVASVRPRNIFCSEVGPCERHFYSICSI